MDKKITFATQVIEPLLSVFKRFSKQNAFCINEVFYSYKQLSDAISSIRAEVKNLNIQDNYIGLIANDDLQTYASIFALWLEGKGYVPLHPNQPISRCEEIINQIKIKSVLNSGKGIDHLNCRIIKTYDLTYKEDLLEYNTTISDSQDAYVLFTSGSTGIPKGVPISRKNLGAFIDSFWDCKIEIDENDRCLQCFDLTFDISVQSFLVPLLKGACVYTIPHNQIKYSYLYGLLEDHHLTFGSIAPSMIRYLKPYFEEINVPSMRYCLLGAEASSFDLIEQWQKCIPNAKIFDFYGPTETTIYCTYYNLSKQREVKTLNGMLSIGRPMKNTGAIIVDEHRTILPIGKKGELCICGDQVSSGYWNNPEKNNIAFFDKDDKGKLKRFYRTGDLAYFDNEGDIMLYGRLDSQTKIQGYRVELGEIEYHARQFLGGANSVVLTFENNIGNSELALFAEGKEIDVLALTDYLKTKLPYYMIPSRIIVENEFPLNSNSKVDKIKLKEKI